MFSTNHIDAQHSSRGFKTRKTVGNFEDAT